MKNYIAPVLISMTVSLLGVAGGTVLHTQTLKTKTENIENILGEKSERIDLLEAENKKLSNVVAGQDKQLEHLGEIVKAIRQDVDEVGSDIESVSSTTSQLRVDLQKYYTREEARQDATFFSSKLHTHSSE